MTADVSGAPYLRCSVFSHNEVKTLISGSRGANSLLCPTGIANVNISPHLTRFEYPFAEVLKSAPSEALARSNPAVCNTLHRGRCGNW